MLRHIVPIAVLVLAAACSADSPSRVAGPSQQVITGPVLPNTTELVGILRYNGDFYEMELSDGSYFQIDAPEEMRSYVGSLLWVEVQGSTVLRWGTLQAWR